MLNHLQLVYQQLAQFATQNDFVTKMEMIFGHGIDQVHLDFLRQSLLTGDLRGLLSIKVLNQQELGTAQGAYAVSNNQIYLSAEFLATASESAIAGVILEEFGHGINALLNRRDAAGDEGAFFSAVVRGAKLTNVEIDLIKIENDRAYITVENQKILVEQANLVGDYFNNVISGTIDNDLIRGLQGNDNLSGLGGNDTLYGDSGSDILRGGAGNDLLVGGLGDDTLYGDAGNDLFVMQYFNDYSTTTNLDIIADFTKGQDKIDLREIGISDFNTMLAITGNDASGSAVVTAHYKSLFAATYPYGYGLKINGLSKAQLQATDFLFSNVATNDLAQGTTDGDDLFGGLGNDTLKGDAGEDRLFGEQGNDLLVGGFGNDTLYGGAGNDLFVMQYFNDYSTTKNLDVIVDFVKGQDKIDLREIGISDFNTMLAITGNDASGSAVITAHYKSLFAATYPYGYDLKINGLSKAQLQATDFLFSNVATNDLAQGTTNGDDLFGGLGDDTLKGNAGEDRLFGEQGNDSFAGGYGSDTFYGGAGNDTFSIEYYDSLAVFLEYYDYDYLTFLAFSLIKNIDVIADFVKGQDKVNLQGIGISDFNTLLAITTEDTSGNSVITAHYRSISGGIYDDGYATKINGIRKNQLQASDFLLSTAIVNDNKSGTERDDDLFGGYGNDTLSGQAGNDKLFGEYGNDILSGGAGADFLYGGAGVDTFLLSKIGVDTIADFAIGEKLGVSASGFGGGLAANVSLTAAQFTVGTTATSAAQRLIFDNISRSLYFDIDGNGAATMVQIAKIAGSASLSAANFIITA